MKTRQLIAICLTTFLPVIATYQDSQSSMGGVRPLTAETLVRAIASASLREPDNATATLQARREYADMEALNSPVSISEAPEFNVVRGISVEASQISVNPSSERNIEYDDIDD